MKKIINVLTVMILLLSIYIIVYDKYHHSNTVVIADTVRLERIDTIIDTIRIITKPKLIEKTIVRTDTIKNDTVLVYESKHFTDSLDLGCGNAQIDVFTTGVDTSIDSIKIDAKIPTITQTEVVTITQQIQPKKTHFFYGPALGIGYGIINRKPDVFIGVSVGWKF